VTLRAVWLNRGMWFCALMGHRPLLGKPWFCARCYAVIGEMPAPTLGS
jgi:hypothetical protein